jgi:hypothetical protein
LTAAIAPAPRPPRRKYGSGTVSRNSGGWRWIIPNDGERIFGRTFTTRELAEADLDRVNALPADQRAAAGVHGRGCSVCGEPGHNRQRHRNDGPGPRPTGRAGRAAAKVRTAPIVAPFVPAAVRPGQRFVVGEDFEDEDLGGRLKADDVYEAVRKDIPGGLVWHMRRVSDGAETTCVPSLWPFIPETPGPLPPAVYFSVHYCKGDDDRPGETARAAVRRRKRVAVESAGQ